MTPQEFGELIRVHREAKGFSIEEMASRLKLSRSIARAIENGNLDDMPHAVYARGFVRAYAMAVEVAPEDLDAGLASLFPEEVLAEIPTTPGPVSGKVSHYRGGGGRLAGVVLLLLVVGVLCGAGWYLYTHFDGIREVVMRPLSAASPMPDSATAETAADAGAVSEPPAVQAAENITAPPVREPVPQIRPEALPDAAPEANTQETPPAPPVAAAGPATVDAAVPQPAPALPSLAENRLVAGKQVGITAKEECWVQVSADGGGTRTFTVYPGETSVLPYKNRMTLVLGNAGGVTLTHNGEPFAHNGKRNEKKTITFQ